MRRIIVTPDQDNKKIDRVIKNSFNKLPIGILYKAFRRRDIKVNGKRVKEDFVVRLDDVIEVFITDELLDGVCKENGEYRYDFNVVFEDNNMMIINKGQGISVHEDEYQNEEKLIQQVRRYIESESQNNISPILCHRIDRNTGGLLIVAKNNEIYEEVQTRIKTGGIRKFYTCFVRGKILNDSCELRAHLVKNANESKVRIYDNPRNGSQEIITIYKVKGFYINKNIPNEIVTKLQVELVTGRTHQIRAHLSYIGNPIIGDGKYGNNEFNRMVGISRQMLWATKIEFLKGYSDSISYMSDLEISVEPNFYKINDFEKTTN